MSRTLMILLLIAIALVGFLTIRNEQTSFQLPADKKVPILPTNEENTNFHEWREYSSLTGHFKVLLPALPQHAIDNVMDPKTHETRKYDTFVTVDNLGLGFIISAITLNKVVPDSEIEMTLKNVINEMIARNGNNKLIKLQTGKFRQLPAVDFSYSNDGMLIAGKVIALEQMLYVLSMINNKDAFNQKELDFFINSFNVIEDKKEK